jgi:hypothetical protein
MLAFSQRLRSAVSSNNQHPVFSWLDTFYVGTASEILAVLIQLLATLVYLMLTPVRRSTAVWWRCVVVLSMVFLSESRGR